MALMQVPRLKAVDPSVLINMMVMRTMLIFRELGALDDPQYKGDCNAIIQQRLKLSKREDGDKY